jgi:hypothetical protein
MDLHLAKLIAPEISKMFEFQDGFEWDVKAFNAALEYLTPQEKDNTSKLWCLIRINRRAKRIRMEGERTRFFNAPDTAHVEGVIAKRTATNRPMLMLFRFDGSKFDGWGGSPFWWPVLMAPENTKTAIFASATLD